VLFEPDEVLDAFPEAVLLIEPDGTVLHANRLLRRGLHLDGQEICGRSIFGFLPESGRKRFASYLQRCSGTIEPLPGRVVLLRQGSPFEYRCEGSRIRRPDGRPGPLLLRCRAPAEAASPFTLLNQNINELKREVGARRWIEAALRQSEEQLRLATEAAEIGLWDVDVVADTLFWPPRVKAMFGISADVPVSMADFYAGLHPDDRDRVSACYAAAADPERRAVYDVEYRTVGKEDGVIRWVAAKGRGLFDRNDRCVRMIGVALDITARRLAAQQLEESEAALRELNESLERRVAEAVAERMKAEEALRHAQKLEAIGQLTGGVAHDFNNLLTVIIGNLDALSSHYSGGKTRRYLDAANRAAERGAMLTQQLLAYARKQHLAASPVDINLLIRGLDDLLRRSLGGLVDVEIRLDDDLWHALTDPTQLELAILNLAINARDAMPLGGSLQIETKNVTGGDGALPRELAPGDYVRLRLSDTGEGMTSEILAKAMDPFFTTKEIGKGSGLGLSQVYGVVKQCGGAIRLESAPGEGTTVLIWLPRSRQVPAEAAAEQAVGSAAAPTRRGTALVVDDDADVRELAVELLRNAGYHVEQAESGESALRILDAAIPIDFAIIDYAMPRMSGIQLTQAARERRPDLPVIYMTGYADLDAIGRDPEATIVKKPYRAPELLRAIERELSRPVRRAGSSTVVPLRPHAARDRT